jgi:hypothetical protein
MCKLTHSPSNRSGVATLEFVMALPLLFVLMICILWEGYWLIGQAEVIVTARNDTWKKRFDNLSDNPLSFPILPEHDIPILPKYVASADYAHEKASTTVDITPAFNLIPGPEAANHLLAGSWDFEAMPLNKPPDFKLMGKAGLLGAFGNVLNVASTLNDPMGLADMFANAQTESSRIQGQTNDSEKNVGKDTSPGGSGGGGGGAGGADTAGGKTPEQAQQESKEKLEARKLELIKRFRAMSARLVGGSQVQPAGGEFQAALDVQIAAQAEKKRLFDAILVEQNEEQKKKLQEEAARAHRKLELARITYKRLEAEAQDIVREADALDIHPWVLNGQTTPF